jgi:hAT family C-terminal dimerisation region
MSEYRRKMAKASTSTSATPSVPPSTPKVQYWEDLTSAYGLDNMEADDDATRDAGQAEQTVLQEYEAYAKALLSPKGTDLVKFWVVSNLCMMAQICSVHGSQQMNEFTFPTLFAMAMDYLPIQASSVPSEHMFSSSSETDTVRRNRIKPALMEAIQMLKFGLKKARLDFTKGWETDEALMNVQEPAPEEDAPEDFLAALLGDNETDTLESLLDTLGDDDDGDEVIEL